MGIKITITNDAGDIYSTGAVTLESDGWFYTDEENDQLPTHELFEDAVRWARRTEASS